MELTVHVHNATWENLDAIEKLFENTSEISLEWEIEDEGTFLHG